MMKPLSKIGTGIAIAPALVVLAVFYSLAIHMYSSLGQWPHSIGTRGFDPLLKLHGHINMWSIWFVVVTSMFAWPLATVVCAIIPQCRPYLRYLIIYVVAVLIGCGLMMLAPEPFLYWVKD